jgi:hypothetical protein
MSIDVRYFLFTKISSRYVVKKEVRPVLLSAVYSKINTGKI